MSCEKGEYVLFGGVVNLLRDEAGKSGGRTSRDQASGAVRLGSLRCTYQPFRLLGPYM